MFRFRVALFLVVAVLGSAAPAMAGVLGSAPPAMAAAAPAAPPSLGQPGTTTTSMPVAQCAQLRHALVSDARPATAAIRATVARTTDRDCTTTVTLRVGTVRAAGIQSASGTWCRAQWWNYARSIGPVDAIGVSVNVQMCWNNSTVWNDWGPDCTAGALPLYTANMTWCGVYRISQYWASVGGNAVFGPADSPWWHPWGIWARQDWSSQGDQSNVYGASSGPGT